MNAPIATSWEWELLLSAGREAALQGKVSDLPCRVPPAGGDWDQVLELADHHGLSPLLYRFLSDRGDLSVPPAVLERLQVRVRRRARENLRLTAELLTLTSALEGEGIPSVAYKGPVLSRRLYGDPALRDYDDLDLLVRARDVAATTELLLSRGFQPWFDLSADQEERLSASQYARHFGHPELRIPVDLHWAFTRPYLPVALSEEAIWSHTEEILLGGTRIRILSDALLLLVLCMHGSAHEPYPWNRLKWIVDVAALTQRIPEDEWGEVLRQARSLRLERSLLFGQLVVHRLLATPLPPEVLERLESAEDLETLSHEVTGTLQDPDRAPGLSRFEYDLRLLDLRRDQLRYLLHRLFVPNPKDWAAVDLPPWLAPAYRVVRPLRLLGKISWRRRP